jgi:hypothetical protein
MRDRNSDRDSDTGRESVCVTDEYLYLCMHSGR